MILVAYTPCAQSCMKCQNFQLNKLTPLKLPGTGSAHVKICHQMTYLLKDHCFDKGSLSLCKQPLQMLLPGPSRYAEQHAKHVHAKCKVVQAFFFKEAQAPDNNYITTVSGSQSNTACSFAMDCLQVVCSPHYIPGMKSRVDNHLDLRARLIFGIA